MTVSEKSISVLSALLEKLAGHPLTQDRLYRIETALGPLLRVNGFASIDDLVAAMIGQRDKKLETAVVEALLNNETYFFRDRTPFELIGRYLKERIFPARSSAGAKIWCAGVSTGQEAYSLVMMLDEQRAQANACRVDILGTDISASAIRKAQSGIYTQFEIQRGLQARQLIRHCEEYGADWRISAALRSRVSFYCQDITQPCPSGSPRYDIILCRNVLLYFPKHTRREIFSRLRMSLAPDGVLVLGAAETIMGQTDAFELDPDYRGLYRPKAHSDALKGQYSAAGAQG